MNIYLQGSFRQIKNLKFKMSGVVLISSSAQGTSAATEINSEANIVQ